MGMDWVRVAADYERSTLDLTKVEAEARKLAEAFIERGVAFDGYTDDEAKSFWKEAGSQGFFATLMKDRTGIDYRHIGFWTLQSVSESAYDQERTKTRVQGLGNQKSFMWAHESRRMSRRIWAVLSDGRLASYSTWGFTSTRMGKSDGHGWTVMTAEDVLLLDHRVRELPGERSNKWSKGYEYGTMLSADNHLLTGKKGGGCLKLMSALRARHGLASPSPRRDDRRGDQHSGASHRAASTVHEIGGANPTAPARERPPISRTYALGADQLQDGVSIRHTFASGASQTVKIFPNTRSGKVIVVRPASGGAAESIRLVER